MSIASSCAILGLQEADLTVSKVIKAYRRVECELKKEIQAADWSLTDTDVSDQVFAKQAERQAMQARLDQAWAAALHLETAFHLQRPGQLCGPLGLSLLEPNPQSWRQAVLLHLLRSVKRDNLVWSNDQVYCLEARTDLWRPFRAVHCAALPTWIWKCCDKDVHYRLWAALIEHGTVQVQKLLKAQPEFQELITRPDAWSWRDRVYLANDQRWTVGIAEQAVPDYLLPLDGDDQFWAAALGWPCRAMAQRRCETGDQALDALAHPALPLVECSCWLANPVPLIDRVEQAVAISFRLDAKPRGPLDRFFR